MPTPFKNSARRQWLERKLDAAGVPAIGRVVRLVETTGLSRPTITTIVRGGLPRDLRVCFQFAEIFSLDVRHWVTGQEDPLSHLRAALNAVRTYETERPGGERLPNEVFANLVLRELRHPFRLQRFLDEEQALFGAESDAAEGEPAE